MPAPTLVGHRSTAFTSATTPKTTSGVDVLANDRLVVVVGASDGAAATYSVTNNGAALTWTSRIVNPVANDANVSRVVILTATTSTNRTGFTVTVTRTGGSQWYGATLSVWRGSDGFGIVNARNDPANSTPSIGLVGCAANSAVVGINVDWNAASNTAAANYATGTAGTATETSKGFDGSWLSWWTWYHADAGAAGTKTVGPTVPAFQKFTIAAIEVLGTTGGASVTRTPAEAVHVTDQVTASWSRSRTAAEQVHVTDQAVTAGSGSVSAAEQVHVTDQVAVSWVRDRAAAEQVHVADDGTPVVTPAAGGDPVTVWAGKEAARGITLPLAANADSALTVGMEVEVIGTPVTVDAIGFYAGTGFSTGDTLTGQVYSITGQAAVAGTLVTFPALSGVPGWQWAVLSTPVELPAGAAYRVAVHLPNGGYPTIANYFNTPPGATGFDDGALRTRGASGTANGQMLYVYGASIGYPQSSFNDTWYGVDVRQPGAAGGDLTRTPAEAVHVADQVDVTWSRTRTVDESVGVADPGATLDTETHLADDVHVADATTQAAARGRAPADAVHVADATAQQASRARTQSDPVQVADQASTTAERAREAADTATVDDVVTFTVAYARQAADTIDVPDQVVVHAVRSRVPADVVGVADVVVVELASASGQTKSDQVHVVESVTVQRVSFRDTGDQVHVTDQVAPAMARPRTVADQVHVVDQVTAGWVRSRSHAEVVTVVDAAARGMARVVTVADLVGVADAAAGVILVGGAGQPLGSPAPEWRTFAVLASSSVISVPLEDDGMTAVAELGVRKDPDAVQDYAVDWTGWLDGDTLASSTWVSMDGLVIDSQSHSGGVSTVVVSGGSNGTVARLRCRVVTGDGRTNDRTVVVPVRHL